MVARSRYNSPILSDTGPEASVASEPSGAASRRSATAFPVEPGFRAQPDTGMSAAVANTDKARSRLVRSNRNMEASTHQNAKHSLALPRFLRQGEPCDYS